MAERVTWSTAAASGARVIPVVLIHGLPAVFVPEGFPAISAISFTSPDALWWPGTSVSTFNTYRKAWLSLTNGFAWSERARPTEPAALDVAAMTATFSDVGYAATALFASRDAASATFITAEVLAADVTINVASTADFASSGTIYLDREAIAYSGKTSTSFTGCTRAQFGSVAARHIFNGAAGLGLGNPQVTDRPVEVIGRLATVWLVEVSGTTLTKLSLEFVGHIGTGAVLSDDGDGWSLSIDHAIKRLGMKPSPPTVTIGGYSHPGNRNGRASYNVDGTTIYGRNLSRDGTSPVVDTWYAHGSTAVDGVAVLTEDDASPDNGGWHATRDEFVYALQSAITQPSGGAISYYLAADGHLHMEWRFSTTQGVQTWWPWDVVAGVAFPPDTEGQRTSGRPMPEAWVPIVGTGRVYLAADDYGRVPPVPSVTSDDNTEAYWCLAWETEAEGQGEPTRRALRILSNTSASGVYYVTTSPIVGAELLNPSTFLRRPRVNGILVTSPTTAKVALYVRSDSWVTALEAAVGALADDLGDGSEEAFDWDRMREVALSTFAGPFATRREYILDGTTSILEVVANECALQGFSLVPYRGRIAIARIADFAPTETSQGAISTDALVASAPAPSFSRGEDGIVNRFKLSIPEIRTEYTFVDATSRSAYGPSQAEISATFPGALVPRSFSGAQLAASLSAMVATVLGPLRYPYEHVGVTVPLTQFDLPVGSLVSLDVWRVPNGEGTRGLPGTAGVRVGQVFERSPTLYGGETEGAVRYTLRVSPRNLAGWAPSALVAAGGISGADVTLDTSTFGAAGFAQTGSDGGAATFAVGDKVRLVEIGATSPTTATQHTVTAVSGAVLTLSPSPNATFAALAASALKVLITYDDWATAVSAQKASAFIAGTTYRLSDGTRAQVYAA